MTSKKVTRREFVSASSFLALGLPVVLGRSYLMLAAPTAAPSATYVPPKSPRATLNFNLNWKFIRQDVPGADGKGRTTILERPSEASARMD